MTFAGKIRTYLVIAALLPPLLIMSVIYFSTIKQLNETRVINASNGLDQYHRLENSLKNELHSNAMVLAQSDFIKQAALLLKSGRIRDVDISDKPTGFDFVEILDSNLKVIASSHRPGLIGYRIHDNIRYNSERGFSYFEAVEYDINGRHAAIACITSVESDIFLYAGWFLEKQYLKMISGVISAEIDLIFDNEIEHDELFYRNIGKLQLYEDDDKYSALLTGSKKSGYYLIGKFQSDDDKPLFVNLIAMTGVVAVLASALALLLGMYITGKAKKEINNLTEATARVAQGDFNTTVMAYEEGEFSQLADSFSEMVVNLKNVQKQLATSEKIAAWKIVGQKVAHEIKNPLTPIAISIDDLRRSYQDKLPEFEKTLLETTSTIKVEINRLLKLLDQFVSFARMNPPEISDIDLPEFINGIENIYQREIEAGKLSIENKCDFNRIKIDSETIKQAIINLIKNGFEASKDAIVSILFYNEGHNVIIKVEDSGPGFTLEILENSFTPYVTTKKDGSGLGLAICQRIIFDHNGTIELYNKQERGAGVLIRIPAGNG